MAKKSDKKDDISVKLRMLRAEHNLSQAVIAEKLGISQQAYSKYEKQNANIDSAIIIKLCEIYGISSDYLLGLEKPAEKKQPKKVSLNKSSEEIDLIVNEVLLRINNKK